MTVNQMVAYCFEKTGVYTDMMSGEQPICIKVKDKVFAQFYTDPDDLKVTFKSQPVFMMLMRQHYPQSITKPFNCPENEKRSWYTLLIDGKVPDDQLVKMMDHAYETTVQSLSKKAREDLEALRNQTKIPFIPDDKK